MNTLEVVVVDGGHARRRTFILAWRSVLDDIRVVAEKQGWPFSYSILDSSNKVSLDHSKTYALFVHVGNIDKAVFDFDNDLAAYRAAGYKLDAWVYSNFWRDRPEPDLVNARRMVNVVAHTYLFGPRGELLPKARREALVARLRMLSEGGGHEDITGIACLQYLGDDALEKQRCLSS